MLEKLKNKKNQKIIMSHVGSVIVGIVLSGVLASVTHESLLPVFAVISGTYGVGFVQKVLEKKLVG